jgi:hypothetical protein
MTEEERRQTASRATSTLGRNLAVSGFGNPTGYTPPPPRSIFGESAQQSFQDFSRLQMPPIQNIPLGNTVPVFPDNYNQAMTDRYRAPSAMVSGIRDTTSDFGIYGSAAQLGSGQTSPMAPVTNAISSFGSPLAPRIERIESQYGTASTTLTPEQQVMRAQARQQAEQTGTIPRTPEEQQALLAQIRQNTMGLNAERTRNVVQSIQDRKENTPKYTTPSGSKIVAPTNRFGEPIQSWANTYEKSSAVNEKTLADIAEKMRGGRSSGRAPSASTASANANNGGVGDFNLFNPFSAFGNTTFGLPASGYAPLTTASFGNSSLNPTDLTF